MATVARSKGKKDASTTERCKESTKGGKSKVTTEGEHHAPTIKKVKSKSTITKISKTKIEPETIDEIPIKKAKKKVVPTYVEEREMIDEIPIKKTKKKVAPTHVEECELIPMPSDVDLNDGDGSFFADVPKGFLIKVMVDSILCLGRGYFTLDDNGITLRHADEAETILFDLSFPRENFKTFRCSIPMTISLNLKHLQNQMRNVKKKDAVTLFIDPTDRPGKFGIRICPEGARRGGMTRSETDYVTFQREKAYRSQPRPEDKHYGHPIVIDASDFQKIKRLTSRGRLISIRIQSGNYLCFSSNPEDVLSSEMEFGEFQSGENVYKASFHANILNMLIKLPGLCTQMQFYAPTTEGYPLRIRMNASQQSTTLGIVQVYIKDAAQIAREEALKTDAEQFETMPKTKGKKRRV